MFLFLFSWELGKEVKDQVFELFCTYYTVEERPLVTTEVSQAIQSIISTFQSDGPSYPINGLISLFKHLLIPKVSESGAENVSPQTDLLRAILDFVRKDGIFSQNGTIWQVRRDILFSWRQCLEDVRIPEKMRTFLSDDLRVFIMVIEAKLEYYCLLGQVAELTKQE